MATLNRTGAGATQQAQQQQRQNMPAWLQGAYQNTQQPQAASNKSAKDQMANVTPRRNDALRQNTTTTTKDKDEMDKQRPSPAWWPTISTAMNTAANVMAGPAGIPNVVTQAASYLNPYLASLLPANKGNDQLAPGSPNKNLNMLSRLAGRTMFGEGVGPGTLDPALWDQTGESNGFGTGYGGNWRRGGGGGGGGGGSDWYNNADNYPEWLKIAMGLNSWNIK